MWVVGCEVEVEKYMEEKENDSGEGEKVVRVEKSVVWMGKSVM